MRSVLRLRRTPNVSGWLRRQKITGTRADDPVNELASKPPGDFRVDGIASRLSVACCWLSQPGTFISAAVRAEPSDGNGRELLKAVPENVMLIRLAPEGAR